jgi:hypothetical protein
MDKFEIRRKNLLLLIVNRCGNKTSRCAEIIGKNPSYVGRLLYVPSKKGSKKIGDNLIDAINAGFTLPLGWLDKPHTTDDILKQVKEIPLIKKDTFSNKKLDELLVSIQELKESIQELKEDISILKKKMDKSDKEV